jgi:DNA end-binding protein Ku
MALTIWKGHLTFGMVFIPIKLFRAARAEKIHMHNLQRKTGARVRQVFVPANQSPALTELPGPVRVEAAETGPSLVAATRQATPRDVENRPSEQGISRSELVRGFEYEKDRCVEFEAEELEKIAPKASDQMEIIEFVRFAEVDPVYLDSSFYVAADRGGDKAYALLFEALKTTGYAAIAEFVMHRRHQTAILRPGRDGIIAHTLFYEDEVNRANEFHADSGLVQPKEMELAVNWWTR